MTRVLPSCPRCRKGQIVWCPDNAGESYYTHCLQCGFEPGQYAPVTAFHAAGVSVERTEQMAWDGFTCVWQVTDSLEEVTDGRR